MSDIPQNAKDLRILIATDNHLGYLEKDPVRGDDSFNSFEEILATAVERDVDFILLGGDLFHDNKPSRKCLHTTMSLLRKYSMGSRNCYLKFLSSQEEIFENCFEVVNYQDPNLNISMPIFSIHGNHDDPSGDGNLCALDILSTAGFINYFGKQRDVDDVKLTPILLQKGNVKLGLYGLGNIRDERLHRTFLKKKVAFLRPIDGADEFFNLFVIHQNRVKHGATNYIPEEFLEDFLDIVVWGHEHECLVDLTENVSRGFYVTQPGSSVATSLCEGEAQPKHIAILTVSENKQYSLESIPLKSVRPFVIDEIMLAKIPTLRLNDEKKIMKVLTEKVESLIEKAHTQWLESHPEVDAEFPKPIVRLKVEYTGFSTINPQRFGQPFVDRVANVKDILQFYRRRAANADGGKSSRVGERSLTLPENLSKLHMNDLINEYLSQFNMSLLSENGINEALRLFVEKEDKDAIEDFVESSVSTAKKSVEKNINSTDDLDFVIDRELGKMEGAQMKPIKKKEKEEVIDVDMESPVKAVKKEPKGKKEAKPVAKRAPKRKTPVDHDDDDDDDDEEAPSTSKRAPKRKTPMNDDDDNEDADKPPAKMRATRGTTSRSTRTTRTITEMFGRLENRKVPKREENDDDDDSFSNR